MPGCALCHDQTKKNEDAPRLAFDFTPDQIVRSAFEKGCDSCLVVLEGLRQSQSRAWSFQRDIRRVYARCRERRGQFEDTLHLDVYFVDDRPKLELEFYSLQPHAWKAILPRSTTSGHPLSPKALNWVLSYLEECKSNHPLCQQPRPPLPKRVIWLSSNGSANPTARLVEPTNQRGSYVALSHCWGTHQTCVTTQETLTRRLTNISWATIPKTFQEAMQLALRLGFRYIWIDSLCIIQDDPADWETESSRMAEIYQGAVLTIAATSSAGDNQGCCSRNNQRHPDLEITLPDDTGACQIAVRTPHKHWDTQTTSGLLKDFPLLTRGWAFQERLLSSRVLHLSASELVWECRESSACECGGLGQEGSPGGDYHHAVEETQEEKLQHDIAQQQLMEERTKAFRRKRLTKVKMLLGDQPELPPVYEDVITDHEASPLSESPKDDPVAFISQTNIPIYEDPFDDDVNSKDCPDLVFHYHHVVEQFSALQLTRPSDRLPAFSGLCKRVQHLRNNYLAGLWSDSICYDLLWRVDTITLNTEGNGTRSSDYRGPTWSWVSVDSPVSYWSDIINFRVTYEGFPALTTRADGCGSSYHGFRATRYSAAGQQADKIEMAVTVPGQNPFGTVTSAILTIEASATTAALRYTYAPHWLGGKGDHDPVRYKLELKYSGQPAEAIDASGQPDETVDIPFYADYSLGAAGPSRVPADSKLTLLLIHPKVCLVLRHAWRNGSRVEVNGEIAWERVGIARISDALLNYYRIDWMENSEVKKFHIV